MFYTIAEYSQPKSAAVYADQQLFNTKYAKDGCSLTRIDLSTIGTVNKKLNETIEKFVEAHYRYDMTFKVLDKMDKLPKGEKATEIVYYGLKHTTEGFLDSINIFGKKKSNVISNVVNDLIKESSKAALDKKFSIGMSKQDFSEAVIEIGASTFKVDTGYVLAKVIDEVVKSGESKDRDDFAKKIVDKILSNESIDPKFK